MLTSYFASKACQAPSPAHSLLQYKVFGLYLTFGLACYLVYDGLAGRRFTSILTISSLFQCLSLALLLLQVLAPGGAGAAGVSTRGLFLEVLTLCTRLSSTLWLNGYLPADPSGDWAYQALDLFSLVLLFCLLQAVRADRRCNYQAEEDTLWLLPLISCSLMLGVGLHANMDERPAFDSLWMASLYTGAAAVVPQLALVGRAGGCLEPLTSHRILAQVMARLSSLAFMWCAREDITCLPWIPGTSFNHAKWSVLGIHCVHLLLLGEFAYLYAKSENNVGMAKRMTEEVLPYQQREVRIVN